jgi:hypothetical protein
MILQIAVSVLVMLLLYYWVNMKPKNFPPGKVHGIEENFWKCLTIPPSTSLPIHIEHPCRVDNIPASYYGGPPSDFGQETDYPE